MICIMSLNKKKSHELVIDFMSTLYYESYIVFDAQKIPYIDRTIKVLLTISFNIIPKYHLIHSQSLIRSNLGLV